MIFTNWSLNNPKKTIESTNDNDNINKIKYNDDIEYFGNLDEFLISMALRESNNKFWIVSRYNMYGKYQFDRRTLQYLGITNYKRFLGNEQLQDSIMILNMKNNERALNKLIEELDGTYWNDIYVTKSGILTGAHLMGPGGVLAFFYPEQFNFRTRDANGIHVLEYIREFSTEILDTPC